MFLSNLSLKKQFTEYVQEQYHQQKSRTYGVINADELHSIRCWFIWLESFVCGQYCGYEIMF